MKKNYIGLSTTLHDPAIAVVDSRGEVVFAEAAERFLQNKRGWNGMPDNMLVADKIIDEYCERDVQLVLARSWSGKSARGFRRLRLFMPMVMKTAGADPEDQAKTMMMLNGMIGTRESSASHLEYQASGNKRILGVKQKFYDHHTTHAAYACFASPFQEAVCVVVDGYGEKFLSTAFFAFQNGKVTPLRAIKGSKWASLGLFYQTLCSLCGFDPLKGEEWKVMGLAPYGKYHDALYKSMRSYIQVRDGRLTTGAGGFRKLARLRDEIHGMSPDPADLAFNGQLYFNELMTAILTRVHSVGFSDNLVLTGGCALNSAYNGKILERTPFRRLYVPSAPADDGNAVGAALLACQEDRAAQHAATPLSPYLGSPVSTDTLDKAERFGRLGFRSLDDGGVIKRTAELLAAGKIVGWVQGRAEFGPRALGNRSILADPRSPHIKKRLNETVKFREGFRPYAPAILHEYGDEYFENYQESPYMERALCFRKEVCDRIPGVVHIDGTGRLQTVKREWNEKFYRLLSVFKDLTGIPLLLNTSFNVRGKPIIHTVEDALAVFHTSDLDVLVIGNRLLEKPSVPGGGSSR